MSQELSFVVFNFFLFLIHFYVSNYFFVVQMTKFGSGTNGKWNGTITKKLCLLYTGKKVVAAGFVRFLLCNDGFPCDVMLFVLSCSSTEQVLHLHFKQEEEEGVNVGEIQL